jgi:uncharacterized membrane protein
MRRSLLIVSAMAALAMACAQSETQEASTASTQPAGFVDQVWTVVDSPGGPGGMYVFLSDGTFVKAARDAAPDVGKWSWNGERITIMEYALPYEAAIDSLTSSYLGLTIYFMDRTHRLGLEPAVASMPDTTRTVEFDPTRASIIANGSDPVWLLTIDNDRAMLRMDRESLSFADGAWVQECAAVWGYKAYRTTDGRRDTIKFQLSTQSCVDSTSGAEYPLHMILQRDGKSYRGCALAGKLHRPR